MQLKMKLQCIAILFFSISACKNSSHANERKADNPFFVDMNVPVDYANVSAKDVADYATHTVGEVSTIMSSIQEQKSSTFSNVFEAMDDICNMINTTSNNCFMLYWVSTDSLTRVKGFAGYQLMDSLTTGVFSDKEMYAKMTSFKSSPAYETLKGNKKMLVDDMILRFERSGVNLNAEQLQKFKALNKEINQLSSDYSVNMNSSNDILILDEKRATGLPENFKNTYKVGEGKYEIPIINATNEPVMNNATLEETRKAYYIKFTNRASDKNLTVLDNLIKERDALGKVMGYPSYAAYTLVPRMAKDPQTVWKFINDLVSLTKEKAKSDIALLEKEKKEELKNQKNIQLQSWDIPYYKNQILKNQYQVNNEKLRAFYPMEQCLKGMFDIYQKLLGLQFKKVNNPSVWHKEVEMYEVYEGEKLKGRFYLDLFPRPNRETWFYGIRIISGRSDAKGDEIPVAMLLGNFTQPTKTLPSLLSPRELNTLFHEFGHIVNSMSYHGEYSFQSNFKDDFAEAMSQLFENWLWNYDIPSSFARNYKTGEVLPKTTFEKMFKAKNVASGYGTIRSLRQALYDMNIYDKYNPEAPLSTDKLWQDIDKDLNIIPFYVVGTHPQASWIHINTDPVYYYGYLWSQVYAKDMFTEFEKNGLTDTKTGVRYRELILANGTQRDILAAVEEFLGRPSNNQAYIKSLGFD